MSWVPLRLPKKLVKRIIFKNKCSFCILLCRVAQLVPRTVSLHCLFLVFFLFCNFDESLTQCSTNSIYFLFSQIQTLYFVSMFQSSESGRTYNEGDKLSKSTHTDALPQDWHPRLRPRDGWRGHEAELPQPLILRPGLSLRVRGLPALGVQAPIIADQNLFSRLKIVNLRGPLCD